VIYAVAFALALMGAGIMAYGSRSAGLIRTTWAMAGNLAGVWLGQWLLHDYAPWLWLIAIDAITAFVVLSHPASKAQAVIGSIYVLQIITHVAFGAAGTVEHVRLYLDLLAFGGVCQLLTLACGGFNGRGRKVAAARGNGGGAAGAAVADIARLELRP
jgi:hypothetical protein